MSGSPGNSNLRIAGLIDWQHTSILPPFLLAGIPQQLQNHDDPVSQSMARPALPDDFGAMGEAKRSYEAELHRRRLVHYHYVRHTERHNPLLYAALTDAKGVLRHRLFTHASNPWEGETLALKVALIQATQKESWDALTAGGQGPLPPCPVAFDAEDVRATMELDAAQRKSDKTLEMCQRVIGFPGEDGWVPAALYEEVVQRSRKLREVALAAAEAEGTEQERAEIAAHWPFDDMDEDEYM